MRIAGMIVVLIRWAGKTIAISVPTGIVGDPRFRDWWTGKVSIDLVAKVYRGHQSGDSGHDLPASNRRNSFTDHFSARH